MRWISTKDLEEHNKEAKEIAIEWFVVDNTFINTFFDWLEGTRFSPERVDHDEGEFSKSRSEVPWRQPVRTTGRWRDMPRWKGGLPKLFLAPG